MAKNVYSLVLTEEIISAVDRAADKNGMSRSNMIDHILADYISFETPQKRFKDIFSYLERSVADSGMRFLNQPSVSMASVVGALSYRYRPTVRYQLELFDDLCAVGSLRVSLRTQNEQLTQLMNEFFAYFTVMERKCLQEETESEIQNGKFYRRLISPEELTSYEISAAIAGYVEAMNDIMNMYFENNGGRSGIEAAIEDRYLRQLATGYRL